VENCCGYCWTPFILEEVVLIKLPVGKALELNEIGPEMLQALDIGGPDMPIQSHRSVATPVKWQTEVVVPIFKKGDKRVQGNPTTQPPWESLLQDIEEEAPTDCRTSDSEGELRDSAGSAVVVGGTKVAFGS